MDPAPPAIRVEGLGKVFRAYERPADRLLQALWRGRVRYREFWALRDVSFEVPRGETFGVVGRNGSGKTTLLQLIAGALAPSVGEVRVAGRMSLLLALGTGFDPRLTGRENVVMNAALVGLTQPEIGERIEAICDFAEIGRYVDEPVSSYSAGMYMRLAFALSIHVDPDVLLIDEALSVGDEAFQRKCFGRLREIRERGATVVLVSHAANAIVELCDRALLLESGERLLLGDPKAVISRYHRLLFAPAGEDARVREEIRELDAAGGSAGASPESEPGSEPIGGDAFDPDLVPRSTVSYVPRGALIRRVRLTNARGQTSNVLRRGELYHCEYEVEFQRAARAVRFGTLIKSVTGFELGGVASHPEGGGISVEAGARLRVRIPFRARLLPGTYFANAGAVGVVDGQERFLHRILDAVMFRVAPERGLGVSEIVDFSAGEPASIEVAKPEAGRGGPSGSDDGGDGRA